MEPQDFKYPYPFEERKPAFINGALFIPKYYFHHDEWKMPSLSSEEVFGNENPVNIEYCSGNGQWICQKAAENPDRNWIAVEMRFDRARKIWLRKMKNGLKNLIVVCGEAQPFAKYYLPQEAISAVFVNFPDPWPKDKHSKNRLFQEPFLTDVSKTVVNGGVLTAVTDDPVYTEQIVSSLNHSGRWKPVFDAPHYVHQWPHGEYGASYFEGLWKTKGRSIHYIQFVNTL